MPGTRMLTFFPAIDPSTGEYYADGQPSSYFRTQPDEAKEKAHALFGSHGDEQIRLVLDYVYQASRQNYTPGGEQVYGAKPKADEVLRPYSDVAPPPGTGGAIPPAGGMAVAIFTPPTSTGAAPTSPPASTRESRCLRRPPILSPESTACR